MRHRWHLLLHPPCPILEHPRTPHQHIPRRNETTNALTKTHIVQPPGLWEVQPRTSIRHLRLLSERTIHLGRAIQISEKDPLRKVKPKIAMPLLAGVAPRCHQMMLSSVLVWTREETALLQEGEPILLHRRLHTKNATINHRCSVGMGLVGAEDGSSHSPLG